MATEKATIKVGDYIASDFYSPIQGFVESIGAIGKDMEAYRIRILGSNRTEFILRGQAVLLWTAEEWADESIPGVARHD